MSGCGSRALDYKKYSIDSHHKLLMLDMNYPHENKQTDLHTEDMGPPLIRPWPPTSLPRLGG